MSSTLTNQSGGDEPERFQESTQIAVGSWWWVASGEKNRDDCYHHGKPKHWLACVVRVGSNYAKLEGVYGHHQRIHLDNFLKECTPEPAYQAFIGVQVAYYQAGMKETLIEIERLTQLLGVAPVDRISEEAGEGSRGLAVLSDAHDLKKYKKDLIRAQEKTLPQLFEQVREQSKLMAKWMAAGVIPLEGQLERWEGCTDTIKERIFHVDLYAGLSEQVVTAREGKPADRTEKVRLIQQRIYMDEECLAQYTAGGMDFRDVKKFDRWLAHPSNIDRLLPFPRCVAAFKIRRERKDRSDEDDGSYSAHIKMIEMQKADEKTFLYIRNGEQVYRMMTELDFGEKLFPDVTEFNSHEPMVATGGHHGWRIIPKRERDAQVEAIQEQMRQHEAWMKVEKKKRAGLKTGARHTNPEFYCHESPHYRMHQSWDIDTLKRMEPFTKASVYYDDIKAKMASDIKEYNRIVLILQGLFDRSPVFIPHPPAKLWTQEGFESAVELLLDKDRTLHYGTPPDFQVYRVICNASLAVGSICVGQERAWMVQEARKENARINRSWRSREKADHRLYRPYGESGPGYLAKVVRLTKKTVTFEWEKERSWQSLNKYRSSWAPPLSKTIVRTLVVDRSKVFNVSAYKPGDFRPFYADPRTRHEYIKWAPYLLAAEDYHAGKAKVGPQPEGKS